MSCLRVENPEHGVTVDDPATGQQVLILQNLVLFFPLLSTFYPCFIMMPQVVLSEKDADMVRRTASNRVPDPNVDLYADHVPWFR